MCEYVGISAVSYVLLSQHCRLVCVCKCGCMYVMLFGRLTVSAIILVKILLLYCT